METVVALLAFVSLFVAWVVAPIRERKSGA